MKNEIWSTIEPLLQARTEIIAEKWWSAVMSTGKPVEIPAIIKQQFLQYTKDIIGMLGTAVPPREKAQAIGAALVQLLIVTPDTIRHTQTALTQELTQPLNPTQAQFLLMRLSALILEIGIGFANAWDEIATLHDTSENRFQSLFENAPISIWEEDFSEAIHYIRQLESSGITDLRRHFKTHPETAAACARLIKILDVNQTTVEMYEAKNKKDFLTDLNRFFVPESYELFQDVILSAAEGKLWFSGEAVNQTATGKLLHIFLQWSVLPGNVEDYGRVLVCIVDITPVKQAEQALRQQANRRQILHRIDREILAAHSSQEIAQVAIEKLHQIIPFKAAIISLHDINSKTFTILAGLITIPENESDQHFLEIPGATIPMLWPERLPPSLKTQVIELESLAPYAHLLPETPNFILDGKHTLLETPLIFQSKLLGAVYLLANEVSGGFSPEQKEIVTEVADSLAVAIHNAQLLEEEKTARAQAEALRDVANMLHLDLNYETLLAQVLERLTAVIETDAAAIMLESNRGLTTAASWGTFVQPPGLTPFEIRNMHYMAKVLDGGQPVIVPDTREAPFWQELPVPASKHIYSWLGVPLIIHNRAIGLLTFDKDEAGFYSQKDADLALAFANQAALTIENARLFAEKEATLAQLETTMKHRLRDLEMVYKVTAVTNEYLDLKTMLIEALHTIKNVIGGCVATVHNWNPASGKKHLLAQIEDDCLALSEPDTIDHLLSQVITQAEPLILQDIPQSTNADEIGYIGIPIHAKGETIGVLSLFGAAEANLAPEDMAMLASVADHIGLNIENIRLRQEAADKAVVAERKRLAEDLHDAVTQGLYSLTLFGTAVQDRLQDGKLEEAQEYAADISAAARQSLKEMRLMLFELKNVTFEQEGLVAALQHRLDTVEGRLNIEYQLNAQLAFALPLAVERTLYFIANEALTNSLKHAGATAVSVDIWAEDGEVELKVCDNGCGISVEPGSDIGGLGVKSMINRAKSLGGTCNIEGAPGEGTNIIVKVTAVPDAGNGRAQGATT